MLIVTGAVKVRPDTFEEALELSIEHVLRSRAEPGCISHEVMVSADDPMRLVFFERWTDSAALKTHFGVPASGAFVKRLRDLADGPTEMKIYDASEASL